jgi:anti-anti-sigma regulatory factor
MPQTIASPGFEISRDGERAVIALAGEWTLDHGRRLERLAEQLPVSLGQVRRAVLDISGIQRLDTLGARLIDQLSMNSAARASASRSPMPGASMPSCWRP